MTNNGAGGSIVARLCCFNFGIPCDATGYGIVGDSGVCPCLITSQSNDTSDNTTCVNCGIRPTVLDFASQAEVADNTAKTLL